MWRFGLVRQRSGWYGHEQWTEREHETWNLSDPETFLVLAGLKEIRHSLQTAELTGTC